MTYIDQQIGQSHRHDSHYSLLINSTPNNCATLLRGWQHVEVLDKEVLHQKTRNQQLIHEIAQLKASPLRQTFRIVQP